MTARMHPRTRLLVVACALLAALPLLPSPAGAATTDVGTTLEAWFRTSPVGGEDDPLCATPAGCPDAPAPPAPPYPEDTLHVGATSGRPEAVTYVAFAVDALPDDVRLTGGTAVFPVNGTGDGAFAADTAELQACLVTEPFEPAAGEPADGAPAADCGVPVPVTYVDGDVPAFEVDLTRFAAVWAEPGTVAGLALVPVPEGTGTWHVTFSGREREAEGAAPPITAVLTYEPVATDPGIAGGFGSSIVAQGPATSTGSSGGSGAGFSSSSSSFSSGSRSALSSSPPAVAAPAEGSVQDPAPRVAPPDAVTGQPVAALVPPAGYPYAVVWLLPLALALGAVVLSRALSGEVEVLGDDDERDLVGRLWLAFFPHRGPTG